MADISKLKIGATTYDIKDADARSRIDALEDYTDYLGVTTTELTDGANTNPITINGESVTAVKGNIANYGSAEFIFNGTVWQLFGDLSGLGELAFSDSATGNYTPAGSISAPDITVTPTASSIEGVDSVGTLPSMTYDAGTETIEFSAGTLPTKATAVSALTAVTAALNNAPVFTGTQGSVTVSVPTP